MIPEDDAALFPWIADNLYTAVLSDSCDEVGHRNQALGPEIRPTDEGLILVGRAKTVLWSDWYHVPDGNPYEGEIQAVDSIRPGDIVVMATGASTRNAPWGELMSTRAHKLGAAGAVVDGYHLSLIHI